MSRTPPSADHAGGVDDEDVVGPAAVAPGVEQLVKALRVQQEEQPLIECSLLIGAQG
jgi:hypothetical protein